MRDPNLSETVIYLLNDKFLKEESVYTFKKKRVKKRVYIYVLRQDGIEVA